MEDKRKFYTILAFVGVIAAIVIYAIINGAASTPPGSTGTTNAGTTIPAAPMTDAERAATSSAVSVMTNLQDDRVRMGTALPFPIPPGGSVELEAGRLASGRVTLGTSESGTIEQLAAHEGRVWVMIEMQPSNKKSILGKSVARALEVVQPLILSADGQYSEPVGLIYQDMSQRIVQIDPDSFVRGLSQAPRLEESRNDQTLWLVFLLPRGSEINSFWLGKKKMVEWAPNVPVKER